MTPGSKRREGRLLRRDGVLEEPAHLVARGPDDHGPLELGVVAPDRGARLADEHVPRPELDVVRDRVSPGAAQPDLTAVTRRGAIGGGLTTDLAERLQHRERGLVSRAQTGLGLRRPRAGVLLQQLVRVLAPARALADQLDLGGALAHHHRLDHGRERAHGGRRDLTQRGALIAEDAGVAVLVRADRAAHPELAREPGEDLHRVLDAGVLRIALDALERRLRAHALDLELGHEHCHLAVCALHVDDGPLGREEAEAREVADVLLVEEDVAAQTPAAHVLEQPPAPRLELGRCNARGPLRALLHLLLLDSGSAERAA